MEKTAQNTNPLSRYYRQPQIYIKLPSGGKYYDQSVIAESATGEHAVMPMTTMDELKFKTPDSLMNGQATVDVIKSCIPSIQDPWKLVNYDIDTVLIALRIASYGETMDVTAGVPGTDETMTHTVNLPQQLEVIRSQEITDTFKLDGGLEITVRPLTYKQITDAQLKTFEQQKMFAQVQNSDLPTEEKTKRFGESFNQLNAVNTNLLIENIAKITLPDGTTVEQADYIKEFVANADAKLIKQLEQHLIEIRQQGSIKPFKVDASEEQIKAGAPASYDVPITFDNANFFV